MSFKKLTPFVLLTVVAMLIGVAGVSAQGGKVTFFSTQFNVVEEAEKFRNILADFDGEVDFVPSEEQAVFDTLSAEADQDVGSVDVVGALHGTFPTLVKEDVLFDLSGLLEEIEADYDIADAFVELGKWARPTTSTTSPGCRPPTSWRPTSRRCNTCRKARTSTR